MAAYKRKRWETDWMDVGEDGEDGEDVEQDDEQVEQDDEQVEEGESLRQRRRIDTFFCEIDKLKRSNVRRFHRCKEMEKKIFSMEKKIEEMKAHISFLESVSADFERENIYFRNMYFGDGVGSGGSTDQEMMAS